jgi:hypothetical protein
VNHESSQSHFSESVCLRRFMRLQALHGYSRVTIGGLSETGVLLEPASTWSPPSSTLVYSIIPTIRQYHGTHQISIDRQMRQPFRDRNDGKEPPALSSRHEPYIRKEDGGYAKCHATFWWPDVHRARPKLRAGRIAPACGPDTAVQATKTSSDQVFNAPATADPAPTLTGPVGRSGPYRAIPESFGSRLRGLQKLLRCALLLLVDTNNGLYRVEHRKHLSVHLGLFFSTYLERTPRNSKHRRNDNELITSSLA